jgi:hypothetical protein
MHGDLRNDLALPASDGSVQWGPTAITIFLVVWVLVAIFLAVVYIKRRK